LLHETIDHALNFQWSDYVANSILNNGLERISIRLLEKRLHFAGHCIRSKQPISKLILWDHAKVVRWESANGAFSANYSTQLLKTNGKVDGLVTTDNKIGKLMLDREAWRSGISMLVKASKSSNSRRLCITKAILLFSII
jgi:hypothetical protein